MRVVIADEALLREGLSRLLAEVGVEVVASVGDPGALAQRTRRGRRRVRGRDGVTQ